MKGIYSYFSISETFDSSDDIPYQPGAYLFYGRSVEERSNIPSSFQDRQPTVKTILITENENQTIEIDLPSGRRIFSLRSTTDFNELTNFFTGSSVYLDITGLTHSTWAWFIDLLLKRKSGNTFVLYSEPDEYKFSDNPLEGQIFDLSKRTLGISPLPRFAKFFQYKPDNFIFMPLLGFEGTRLAHIWEDIQPKRENTFPVFGVPGFRHDYPFYSYQGNKLVLTREEIWKNWRYEKANCPVSIFVLGSNFLTEYPDKILRIAPIGTKPHALGAILLKLANPNRVDIIYDHPIRQNKRTKGRSNTICYSLNVFRERIANS